MIDVLGELFRSAGRKSDAASPTGSLHAKMAEMLNRLPAGAFGTAAVQYGSITANGTTDDSNTVTISTVDTARTVVIWLGQKANTGNVVGSVRLKNATTVSARSLASGAVIQFCVVTFASGSINSIQQIEISVALSTTGTIASVDTTKTLLIWNGVRHDTNDNLGDVFASATLTNSTTVTAARTANGGTCVLAVTVLESK
jgi:hypothetical protein